MYRIVAILSLLVIPGLSTAQGYIPDPTFGTNGFQLFSAADYDDYPTTCAITSDHKLLMIGRSSNGYSESFPLIHRLLENGDPDASFGINGTSYLTGLPELLSADDHEVPIEWVAVFDAAPQSNGKLIVYGAFSYTKTYIDVEGNEYEKYMTDLFLCRLTDEGWIDTLFGENGVVKFGISHSESPVCIKILSDDKIVLLDNAQTIGGNKLMIFRMHPNGEPDNTFSGDGKWSYIDGNHTYCTDIVVDIDGAMYVSGYELSNSGMDCKIYKISPFGELDLLFGTNGILTDSAGLIRMGIRIAVNEDRVVLAGSTYNDSTAYDIFIRQYDKNGTADSLFSTNGEFQFNAGYNYEYPAELFVKGDTIWTGIFNPYVTEDFIFFKMNTDGEFDTTFGNHGISTIDFKLDRDMVVDFVFQDNNIILAGLADYGMNFDYAACRILSDGILDLTFAEDGLYHKNFGYPDDYCTTVFSSSTGTIYLGGHADNRFFVMKLLENASVDFTFNEDGISRISTVNSNYLTDMKFNDDGDIIGLKYNKNENFDDPDDDEFDGSISVMKFNSNGELDTLFGQGGISKFTDAYWTANEISSKFEIQQDGKIIVTGYNQTYNYSPQLKDLETRFVLFRMNADGSIDSTFGLAGSVIDKIQGSEQNVATDIELQYLDKILITGYSIDEDQPYGFKMVEPFVIRYFQDGRIDSSFGENGVFRSSVYSNGALIKSMDVLPDNKILLAGYDSLSSNMVMVFRLDENGTLDTTFNEDGMVLIGMNKNVRINSITTDSLGNILLCGGIQNDSWDFFTIRLNSNGIPDNTFGNKGQIFTDLTGEDDIACGIIGLENQKIFVGGTASIDKHADFAAVRFTQSDEVIEIHDDNQFLVFPNPIADNQFTIQNHLVTAHLLNIQLYNTSGQIVQVFSINQNKSEGDHTETFILKAGLARGNYFLDISTQKSKTIIQVIIL